VNKCNGFLFLQQNMKHPSKEILLKTCKALLLERIAHAEKAMKAAQESSNSEDKSSAGDKYETARAMGQLDRNMNAKQLAQAQHELNELLKIEIQPMQTAKTGALVVCKTDIYFIAVGLGPITIDGERIIVLSPKSPLATELWGKKKGDTISFNQRNLSITNVL
jgi:transcription elongation GreA/GreB family factor